MAVEAESAAPRPRVLFYSHDGTGLGHLRITLGIASAFAERRPDASVLLLSGSQSTHAWELPPNLDDVKLPSMPKRRLYEGLPPVPAEDGAATLKDVVYLREAVARATVAAFAPQLIVVDHAPAGLFREMANALSAARLGSDGARLALLMRDITFGPGQTREIWTREGVYPLLDHTYDRILVYGSRRVYDPITAYGMSTQAAAKTAFCGYLTPPPPRRDPAAVRAALGATGRPLVLVTVGGGADGGPTLRAYLQGLRQGEAPPGLVSFVVTGPLLDAAERQGLDALAAGLPDLTLTPFEPDLAAVLEAADAVVCMGGYNAMSEAVFAGKRPVVVPRRPGPEEQILRARRFAELGLASVVPPDDVTSATLWRTLRAELGRGTAPPAVLPFDGRGRIVAELAALLPR